MVAHTRAAGAAGQGRPRVTVRRDPCGVIKPLRLPREVMRHNQ